MSLDAQDWVWNHSQSKGTARLVLLAIADKAYGKDCSAYAGTTMLVQRSNAARSSVVAAVDKLIELGELRVVEGQMGPRGETFYSLPKARHHRRSASEGGPESGPVGVGVDNQNEPTAPRNDTQNPTSDQAGGPESGPVQNPDRSENRTGTESGPGGSEIRTPGGPKSGPHNAVPTQAPKTSAAAPLRAAATAREITDEEKREFGAFWAVHPKSRAMDKTKSAWAAAVLSGVDPKKITAAAEAYAHEVRGKDWQFIKQSDGWLREHRYEDKFPPRPSSPQPGQLPPWCGECADGNRAAERTGHIRQVYDDHGNGRPCPKCHPDMAHQAA